MKKRTGKLLYKILFLFLILSTIPLLFIRFHVVNISQKSIKENAITIQSGIAIKVAESVESFIDNIVKVLFTVQSSTEFRKRMLDKQKNVFNKLTENYPMLIELSSTDIDGNEYLKIRRNDVDFSIPTSTKWIDKKITETVLKEHKYIGQLEMVPIKSSFDGRQHYYPVVNIVVAVNDEKNSPVGLIAAKVDLSVLSDSLTETVVGKKGLAYIIDTNGVLIAHPDKLKVLNKEDFSKHPFIKRFFQTKSLRQQKMEAFNDVMKGIQLREFNDRFNNVLVGSYAQIRDLPWWVIVQQPLSEVYTLAQELESQVNLSIIIVILVTLLFGIVSTNFLVGPIKTLQKETEEISQGNYYVAVTAESNDEIGELADKFSLMAKSLKERTNQLEQARKELEKWNQELEKRVQERTKQLKEAYEQLKSAQEEKIKMERLSAVGEMANVVGHEIRNPLAIINNSAYYIKTKLTAADDPKVPKHLGIIEGEIENANKIINDLLNFSRTREIKSQPTMINEIIEEVFTRLPIPANVEVTKELDKNIPISMIDSDEMRQVILNLVGNAVQAMTEGGKIFVRSKLVVDRELYKTPTENALAIRVEVEDTGCGIPPEVLQKIFQPFFTTKSKGTGLGLSVVNKVVDRHKGKLDVVSQVGKGTTFIIRIPVISPPTTTSKTSAS